MKKVTVVVQLNGYALKPLLVLVNKNIVFVQK